MFLYVSVGAYVLLQPEWLLHQVKQRQSENYLKRKRFRLIAKNVTLLLKLSSVWGVIDIRVQGGSKKKGNGTPWSGWFWKCRGNA